jgi:general secretion pathway protein G
MRCLNRNNGFTLVEVVMVIIILGILASIAMKSLDTVLQTTRIEETKRELRMLAIAIACNSELYSSGLRTDYGYVGDIGNLPTSLDDLVTNPGYSTWNGPYIKSDFTSFSDDFKLDAWGNNYIYTGGNTILSTGNGQDSLRFLLSPGVTDFTSNTVTGTVTDALGNPPGDSNAFVQVILSYPNGFGSYKDSAL